MVCEAKGTSYLSCYLFTTITSSPNTIYFFPLEVYEIKHESGLHLHVYVCRCFSLSSPHSFTPYSTFTPPIFQ